jgi:hypothetical protein
MDFGRVVALCSFYRDARLVTTKIMGLPKAPFLQIAINYATRVSVCSSTTFLQSGLR